MVTRVGLIFATFFEAGLVIRRLGLVKRAPGRYEGSFTGKDILLWIAGPGLQAAFAIKEQQSRAPVEVLVSCGFAGALQPHLKAGDIVGRDVISVPKPVLTPEERRALGEKSGACAVDMETQAIRDMGKGLGIPVRVARAISDEFHDNLTPVLGKEGHLSRARIALRLLWPGSWPTAWKLYRQSRTAKAHLTRYLVEFLSTL